MFASKKYFMDDESEKYADFINQQDGESSNNIDGESNSSPNYVDSK
jgi:hypothetical protein